MATGEDGSSGFAEAQARYEKFRNVAFLDDLLDIVTVPQEVKGASIDLLQECMRADDLLVAARVRVAFISGGNTLRRNPIWHPWKRLGTT